jgi:phosphoglycerol transferase
MLFLSAILTLCALILFAQTLKTRLASVGVSALLFASLSSLGLYAISDYLTGNGIDEALIYHIFSDLGGAGFGAFTGLIALSVAYLIVVVIISVLAYRVSRSERRPHFGRARMGLALAALTLSFLSNPALQDLARLHKSGLFAATAPVEPAPSAYSMPAELNAPSTVPRNIVYLYLESVERTYLDENRFPGLMPNLARLEKNALSFTDIRQVWSTGWTIAGMTASQCGVPLARFIQTGSNSMSGVDEFLPGAVCLGDLLSAQGYNLHYLGGSSLSFAGKGAFYRTHQFDRTEGLKELQPLLEDPDYTSVWGLYDDSLYDIATERFRQLSASGEPFGLFLLTLDTHHPEGHMSEGCQGLAYGDGTNPILNAVHCADRMAARFIESLRNSPHFDDTLIVVASDHLALRNSAWETLESGPRRNLLMVLGEDVPTRQVDKPGSTLDIGPTTLDLLGYPTPALGFGRNLLATKETLVTSKAPADEFLSSQKGWLSGLWEFPSVTTGITFNADEQRLQMNKRHVQYPVIFLLNERLNVQELRFEFDNPTPLPQQLAGLDPDQRFIWVDRCNRVDWLATTSVTYDSQYCAVLGSLSHENNTLLQLQDNMTVTARQVYQSFHALSTDASTYHNRRQTLKHLEKFGTPLVNELATGDATLASHIARSAGGIESGESYVLNVETGTKASLQRGVSLLGLRRSSSPEIISHQDTCAGEGVNSGSNFNDLMTDHANDYENFAVVAHDSAVCGNGGLERLLTDTPLSKWQEITLRRPYIGLISPGAPPYESVGRAEDALVVLPVPST